MEGAMDGGREVDGVREEDVEEGRNKGRLVGWWRWVEAESDECE